MNYLRITAALSVFSLLAGSFIPLTSYAVSTQLQDRIDKRIEKLEKRLSDDKDDFEERMEEAQEKAEKAEKKAAEKIAEAQKKAEEARKKAEEKIAKLKAKHNVSSTELLELRAIIDAALSANPIIIDKFDKLFLLKRCLPWGHLFAPGWIKNNPTEWRAHLERCLSGAASTTPDSIPPVISSINVSGISSTSATVTWNTDESATGRVFYSTTNPVSATSSSKSHEGKSTSHSITLTNLATGTTHYFFVRSIDKWGNVATSSQSSFTTLTTSTPPADTSAPSISNVVVSGITDVGATVSWNTSENATGKIYYSSVSPVNLATATTVSTTTLATSRALAFSGLTASTTYYFVLESKDSANNTATSSQLSFTTAVTPDTTSPIISALLVSGVSSTSANVSWNVNELATGKVYYSTTSPVNTSTAFTVGTTTSLFSHLFALTGLNASTTYFLLIESKDASGNTATTTSSFTSGN